MILIFIEYMYLVVTIIIGIKNKEKVQKDLDLMIEVTSKYEGVITDIRMKNHENRNQLIVIKDIINQNSEKAISYIDAMLQNKYNDDEELILKVANIPVGGLKGLIYYKLLTMKSNGIDGHLEISKRVNKNVLSGLDEKVTQSFYKIIGVFLDNAIDAVKKLDKKIILIELISLIYTNNICLFFYFLKK